MAVNERKLEMRRADHARARKWVQKKSGVMKMLIRSMKKKKKMEVLT